MTAYGRARLDNTRYEVTVELSSVNKRHLDIVCRLPREYQYFEVALRRELSKNISRGQVTVSVFVRPLEKGVAVPLLNWPWIDGQKDVLLQVAERVGCNIPLENLCMELWRHDSCFLENKELSAEVEGLILKAVAEAFTSFDEHRKEEGRFLQKEFEEKISLLRQARASISRETENHAEQIRKRLIDLVGKHVSEALVHDDRFHREVVLQADRADVSEELSRIEHHLDHAQRVCADNKPAGKVLEFVLQELLREFNTLGSKTMHAEVSTAVIMAKTELEKMREQVQNVE
jgi:uncharacterized protein (TIGR00255 family)